MRRTIWLLILAALAAGQGDASAAATEHAGSAWAELLRSAGNALAGRDAEAVAGCDALLRRQSDNVHAHVLRGTIHLRRKRAAEALADFDAALRLNPDSAALHLARARAYHLTRDYDRAVDDYTAAIRLDPASAEAYAGRAGCYRMKKVTGKAIADYTTALRLAPNESWVRCARADACLWGGQVARSLADVEEVLRNTPDDRQAATLRCLIHFFGRRDLDRVIADATAALRREPRESFWYSMRGLAYLARGEYVKAACDGLGYVLTGAAATQFRIERHSFTCLFNRKPANGSDLIFSLDDDSEERIAHCTERLARNPGSVPALYERASACGARQDFRSALADFEAISGLDPEDAEAWRNRGHCRLALGQHATAVEDFSAAIRLDPTCAENFAGRASASGAMGKYEEALRDATEAIRLDPTMDRAYAVRGWVHENRQEYDRAIADYTEAIRLCPADPSHYLRRAQARRWTWDCAGMIADYRQIVRLNPSDRDARADLAEYLSSCPDATLRNGKEAREHATAACKASSWRDPVALESLAIACAECGDFGQAVKWQTEALKGIPEPLRPEAWYRLQLYRAHRPYHVASPDNPGPSHPVQQAGADDNRHPLIERPKDVYDIDTQHFGIPIKVDPGYRDTLETIRIFVSEDQGKTWTHERDLRPTDEQMVFRAGHDGQYWFAIQEVSRGGGRAPAGRDGLVPALKVRVNTPTRRPGIGDPVPEAVERLQQKLKPLDWDHPSK